MIRMINPPMPDQLKTNTLVGFLDGEARDLIDDMSDVDKNDYDKVVQQLRSHYESQHFRGLARQKLSDCKQTTTESVRDFAERIKKLVKKATIGQSKSSQNERLLDEFLDRLKPVLRFHVKATNPSTFDEALVKALTYESLLADTANSLSIIPVQPTQPPNVNVATNFGMPYRQPNNFAAQRRPRQQPALRYNQRINERAPNSNIVCYRCGRQGHIQMFCRYSLPPNNLRPPRAQFQNSYQPNRPATTVKPQNQTRANQGANFRNAAAYSRNYQGTAPHRVYALDTTDVTANTAPSIEQQKDAQIAALIQRNRELADIVSGTHNLNLDDNEGRSSPTVRASNTSTYSLPCAVVLALLVQTASAALPPAYICSRNSPASYWRIPSEINCTRLLPNYTSEAHALKIHVYRPNTIRYKSTADVCRIISQTVIYSVNFFGARNQRTTSQEHTVSPTECRHMIKHRNCAYGDLLPVGSVVKTMNTLNIEWPSAPFHCCSDYTTTVTNCVIFQATVYAYHGSTAIESSIGPVDGCHYKDGACTTKTGAAIIWEPDTQESCQFVSVAPMQGTLVGRVWLSESKEFALSFSLSDPHIFDCGKSLILTDQGYAIEPLSSLRSKRHMSKILGQVGLATTNQLAAQLLAVEDNMQSAAFASFQHAIHNLCSSVNSLSSSLIAAISSQPTIAMRKVLQRSDIEAAFLGENIVPSR
ncbi:hypothetical protein ANCCAN_28308 [Ancylostoma caninum]|uniref:CCHC-type domain-containing protein n=1 Tax=Ancylostoma caninum TaxID=29170 RepID=A0A368F505_ANCCA|nr:hypothetical protein ANCCAN_28308 [Ancylostoma caninum]